MLLVNRLGSEQLFEGPHLQLLQHLLVPCDRFIVWPTGDGRENRREVDAGGRRDALVVIRIYADLKEEVFAASRGNPIKG